jgi:hypothetical protein
MLLGITGETGNITKPRHAVDVIGPDGDDQPQFGQP